MKKIGKWTLAMLLVTAAVCQAGGHYHGRAAVFYGRHAYANVQVQQIQTVMAPMLAASCQPASVAVSYAVAQAAAPVQRVEYVQVERPVQAARRVEYVEVEQPVQKEYVRVAAPVRAELLPEVTPAPAQVYNSCQNAAARVSYSYAPSVSYVGSVGYAPRVSVARYGVSAGNFGYGAPVALIQAGNARVSVGGYSTGVGTVIQAGGFRAGASVVTPGVGASAIIQTERRGLFRSRTNTIIVP